MPTNSIESGQYITVETDATYTAVTLGFEKFDKSVHVDLEVFPDDNSERVEVIGSKAPSALSKSWLRELSEYRKEVYPDGLIVGDHPALLKVFGDIRYALEMGDTTPILLLGEPGVGKTHIAKLLHQASAEAKNRLSWPTLPEPEAT